MKLIDKISRQYADLKYCCCGNCGCAGDSQAEAFKAGFIAARHLIAKKMGESFPYPDGKGLYLPLMIHEIGEEDG